MKNSNPSTGITVLNDNLFTLWEQELALRCQLRTSSSDTALLPITAEKDVEILWRALYYSGQKDTFWALLAENMHLSPVLTWLVADESRREEFLAFLPAYLRQNKLDLKKLQSLVNLYDEKFNGHFVSVAATMNTEACSFLASRSANPQWRKLINQRRQFLNEKRKAFFYSLDEQILNSSLPTVQGDKISLLASGVELIQTSMTAGINRSARLNIILEAVEVFFKVGMIDESLALLVGLYRDYSAELSETDNQSLQRQFNKLLRKTVSVYCLIYKSEIAGHFYDKIYHDYFSQLEPDNVTLKYLNVYVLLQLAKKTTSHYGLYQIAFAAEQISFSRSDEYLLLSKADLDTGLSEERTAELKTMVEQKLVSLPHEAFITMQLLLSLIDKQLADANLLANFLLNKALLLFQWIPSSLFINNSLLESLAPLVNDESRYEAEKIAAEIKLYNNSDISYELSQKPELFKSKDAAVLRQIAAGKYLGVL